MKSQKNKQKQQRLVDTDGFSRTMNSSCGPEYIYISNGSPLPLSFKEHNVLQKIIRLFWDSKDCYYVKRLLLP